MNAFRLSDRIGRAGLRSRVIILVLLAVAPLLGLLISGAIADRELALANARAHAVELARFGAERQADLLQQARELLTVLRRMPEFAATDPEVCRATVKMVAADHPQFYAIGVVGPDGTNRCHSIITTRQAFADVALFRQTTAPGAPEFTVGQYRIGSVSGKPVVLMASPLPKAADGTPGGMVFASLNLESFQRVSAELALTHRQVMLVIDPRTGTLLAHAPDTHHLAGRIFADHPLVRAMIASPEGGSLDTEGFAGVPRLFGFARLPAGGGVMMAVGFSRSDVLADANWRFLVGLSIAGIAMLGALAAAWLLGHVSQFRPVRHLVDTARMLGRGDLAARATMEPWQAPEFRLLGSTLNHMATAIARGQQNLRDSEAELRLLADNATDMIFKLDLDFRRTYVSTASREVLGYEPHELIGKQPAGMAHPDDAAQVNDSYVDLMAGQGRSTTVTRIQHRDGHWIWIEVHKRALLDPETGKPIGIIGSMRDITRRKQTEDELAAANERLKALASKDALTGLANRRSLDEVLDAEWQRATREKSPLGLIMLDVDQFKAFNDIYGHQAGDDGLRVVARAIEAALRRPADFAARYGGEEFVVVLPGTDEAGTIEVAERIRQLVADTGLVHSGNAEGVVTISAGIWAAGTAPPATPRDALKSADANLYAAKAAGRNRVCFGELPAVKTG